MNEEIVKIKEKVKNNKTADEVLQQKYLSAYDLQKVIPHLSYDRAIEYINMFRAEMEEKKYFVPGGKTKVALTKLIVAKLKV